MMIFARPHIPSPPTHTRQYHIKTYFLAPTAQNTGSSLSFKYHCNIGKRTTQRKFYIKFATVRDTANGSSICRLNTTKTLIFNIYTMVNQTLFGLIYLYRIFKIFILLKCSLIAFAFSHLYLMLFNFQTPGYCLRYRAVFMVCFPY